MTAPTTRSLSNPYFLIRTPDGLGSYLNRECRRLLLSVNEPLSAFLAPIKTTDEGRGGMLEYDLDAIPADSLERMEYLPETLLHSLGSAIDAFLDRCDDDEKPISDHEKRIRKGFRLPDPDTEPDAYWLYGPVDDRKLLILWGCEFKQNSALPLRSGGASSPGLLEKLAARKPTWRQTQDCSVRLIRERQLPLAPFLASATVNASGQLDAYLCGGRKIPAAECRQSAGKVPLADVESLRKAAEKQYERALDTADSSAYEKSLIRAFQLPDPDKCPDRYQKPAKNGGLFIVLNGKEQEAECLHPTTDTRLNIPAAVTMEDGSQLLPDTVVDKLMKRATAPSKMPIYGAAAAALVLLAGLLFFLLSDRTPPEVLEVLALNDRERVTIVFSEPVDPATIVIHAGTDATPLRIQHERGHALRISRAEIDPQQPAHVHLATEALSDRPYTIEIHGIADRAGNLMAAPVSKRFQFRDNIPPVVEQISAHPDNPRQLILVFNKALDPTSANSPGSFELPGFTVTAAQISDDERSVTLTTNERFEHDREYTIGIRHIRDATSQRNPIAENTRKTFVYTDSIPPAIERVAATGDQITVRVVFTKAVDPVSAENPANFQITAVANADTADSPTELLTIRSIRLLGDHQAVDIFMAEPLQAGVTYQISARNILDRASPPNRIDSEAPATDFAFQGTPDVNPPRIVDIALINNTADRLRVVFDKPINEVTALQPESYRVEEVPVEIIEVSPTRDPNTFVLRLATPLQGPARHHLRVTAIEDFLGNRIEIEHRSPPFEVRGTATFATDLAIESARASVDGSRITLRFVDELIPEHATNPANFQLSGRLRLHAIEASPPAAPNQIVLILDDDTPLTPGRHQVRISNQRLDLLPGALQHTIEETVTFPN